MLRSRIEDTSERMCLALAAYGHRNAQRKGSIRQLEPLDLAAVLRPLTNEDDLLEEMLDASGPLDVST